MTTPTTYMVMDHHLTVPLTEIVECGLSQSIEPPDIDYPDLPRRGERNWYAVVKGGPKLGRDVGLPALRNLADTFYSHIRLVKDGRVLVEDWTVVSSVSWNEDRTEFEVGLTGQPVRF